MKYLILVVCFLSLTVCGCSMTGFKTWGKNLFHKDSDVEMRKRVWNENPGEKADEVPGVDSLELPPLPPLPPLKLEENNNIDGWKVEKPLQVEATPKVASPAEVILERDELQNQSFPAAIGYSEIRVVPTSSTVIREKIVIREHPVILERKEPTTASSLVPPLDGVKSLQKLMSSAVVENVRDSDKVSNDLALIKRFWNDVPLTSDVASDSNMEVPDLPFFKDADGTYSYLKMGAVIGLSVLALLVCIYLVR